MKRRSTDRQQQEQQQQQPSVTETEDKEEGMDLPTLVPGKIFAYLDYSLACDSPPQAKKTPKLWQAWRCATCWTNTTPERRAGPGGRNTLCNACGIKYQKAQKDERLRKEEEIRSTRERMSVRTILNQQA